MRCTQADATGMLPSLAEHEDPRVWDGGGRVGDSPKAANTRGGHGDIQVGVYIVLCGIQTCNALYPTPSTTNYRLLMPGPPIVCIILREGRLMNDRHIFAWPEWRHTHRCVCYVRWRGPSIRQDQLRSLYR